MTDDRYRDKKDPYFEPHDSHREARQNDGWRNDERRNDQWRDNESRDDAQPYRQPSRSGPHPDDQYHAAHHPDRHFPDTQHSDAHYRQASDQDHGRPRDPEDHRYDHTPHDVTYPVLFHGKTAEYFKIWIVNIFLTIITLYIYSAWAKVRTKRYFYGNTTIDGSTFEYHAIGKQLVVGKLLAALLLIVYTFSQGINATLTVAAIAVFVLVLPWVIWRSLKFNARASSFRNIRFGFDGGAATPYVALLLIPGLIIGAMFAVNYVFEHALGPQGWLELDKFPTWMLLAASIGIAILFFAATTIIVPLLHKTLISYSHNNHRYGTARFSANIKFGRIYGIYFVTMMLTVLAMLFVSALIYGSAFILSGNKIPQNESDITRVLEQIEPYLHVIVFVLIYVVIIPATAVAVAYFRSAIRNHRYNATSIDSRVRINSTTTTGSLWWLNISNLLLILMTIGFAYPYTKIRTARYFANRTSITVSGGLESFTENERTKLRALGEEMADAFDVGFDIGV